MPCLFPLCTRATADDYCIGHKMYSDAPKVEKNKVPIARLSEKRKALQKEYVAIVKQMLGEDRTCHVKAPGCHKIANGMQHIEKRSAKNLCDLKNLIRCCGNCQTWIENNPQQAIELKVSKSKFTK
jgi:hypothetical protein